MEFINRVADVAEKEGHHPDIFLYDWNKVRLELMIHAIGGLAFNKTKQCILGPHRGGTIGKASGENYTIFMNMGWNDAKEILPRP